jgi:isoleucyl-tRNA synthetase
VAFKEIKGDKGFTPRREDFNYPQMEKRILSFWKENKIFEKSIQKRKDAPKFVFYEGPPTANGKPGVHHVISRTIKDLICRYKTMRGYRVDRKAGWDTHGLPVEIEVEKELGLKSKKDVEEYGIANFNAKCKESVFRYLKDWDELTERIGYWLDLKDAYITYTNEYIESVWWSLSEFYKKGLIYKGHKIVPYCPRCGTTLSSHEVAQGYEETEDPSVFIKMRLERSEDTYFLVWTTTPWTLISNVALAVHPDVDYVKIEHKGEKLILSKELLDKAIHGEYKILEEFKGKKLEKTKYIPLFEYAKLDKNKAFYVCLADFVTTEDGTGIVHIAPAFGADDYGLSTVYNLPLVQPVDSTGNFTDEVTPWKGVFVKDADPKILEDLKKRGLLYYSGKYVHTYPFCWRCDSPLIYYARKSWYIKTTAYKDRLVANNNKINWYPEEIGKGRFGEWLENNVDWALSRERFWGTPLNIWLCEKCGEERCVSSIEELRKLGKNVPQKLDLHKPMIDEVTFECSKCKGLMRRTPEVIDCWFDSGSMPYAQFHYPFENKEYFKEMFPSEFISEAVDQTRGWFYSLLAISAFLFDQPAYKNVIVIEFILDKEGLKMSKHKGNVVDPWDVLNKQGADALRWYLVWVSQPWLPTRFDVDGVTEVERKFLSTLRNTYSFFALYANIDKFSPSEERVETEQLPEIDRWIISKQNSLIKEVIRDLDSYDITRASRKIQDFVIEDLSNWYVRRNRRRFWQAAMDESKLSAYQTLWEVLVDLTKLIAPFVPFISEELYQELVAKKVKSSSGSVHVESYPGFKEELIDLKLEDRMDKARIIASLARAGRNRAGIKIRQPLERMLVLIPPRAKKDELETILPLISEEINIKNINLVQDELLLVDLKAKPKFQSLGPKFGKRASKVAELIRELNSEKLKEIKTKGKIKVELEGQQIEFTTEDLELEEKEKEGLVVESGDGYRVGIDPQVSESLKDEGFARELVNKIQNMRRQAGFQVMDKIKVNIVGTERIEKALRAFESYIRKETLADVISLSKEKGELTSEWDINGEKTEISVTRIKR